MNKYLAATAKLSVLTVALLSAACGGGGGSTATAVATPAPAPAAPVAQRSVSGVAAKGTIKYARVQVFALDAQGNKGSSALASAVTAEDGSYTVKIATTALRFVVEIDAANGALIADEASGQDLPFPAAMKLRNVVSLAEANDTAVTSHVSPLTELVVQTAESAVGGLNTANIAQAKAGISAALGFDPEKIKPVNSNNTAAATASPEERMQSLTLAALSKLAQDGKLGCAQASASDRVACVVKEVARSGSISGDKLSLVETVRSEVRQAMVTVTANPAINKTGVLSVNGYASFSQGVVPTVGGAPTGVASAKTLFGSLRTNLQAWSDSTKTGGSMAGQYASLRSNFDAATAPLDHALLDWVKLTARGIEHLAKYKAGTAAGANVAISFAGGAGASCTAYSDAAATIRATSAGNALNVGCSVERVGSYIGSSNNMSTFALLGSEIVMTPVVGQSTSFTYSARATRATRSYTVMGARTDSAKTTVGRYGSSGDSRATGTLAYSKMGTSYTSVAVNGMMPARMNEQGAALSDYETWTMSAQRSVQADGVMNYAVSGQFTAWLAGAAVGKVALEDGSFAHVLEDQHDLVDDLIKEIKLQVSAEAGISKVAGVLHMENFSADKNGRQYLPGKIGFAGSISSNNTPFFSGTLSFDSAGYAQFNSDLAESASNFVKMTASMTGTFSMPTRPALQVSATISNDAFGSVTESAQYNDGAVVFSASRVDNGTTPAVVKLASATGVALVLTGSDNADVMKDGVKVAIVNLISGIITYADGSFESLK